MSDVPLRLRGVSLPVPGTLYLHSMPGRLEPFDQAVQAFQAHGIEQVICLTPMEEIWQRAPAYARALLHGVPWDQRYCPIPNFGVPEERAPFVALVREVAARLRRGDRVLVHCAAGIGRTGTFAMAVALQLGLPLEQCIERVRAAGSAPDTSAQAALVQELAAPLRD